VSGQQRALRAAQLAVEDQSVDVTDPRLSCAAAGVDCSEGRGYPPTLTPGEEFSVCVTVTVRIPLLPEFIAANSATGQFVVERETAPSTADSVAQPDRHGQVAEHSIIGACDIGRTLDTLPRL
jgi:hypothetical protein